MGGTGSSRRGLIVDVARSLFLERGYDGTKIGEIAQELGVSKAAVSYHFPTKAAFLDEFIEPLVAEMERVCRSTPADAADSSAARSLCGEFFDCLIANAEIARWLDTDLAVRSSRAYGPRLERINECLVRAITSGSRKTVDRSRAFAVVGGLWRPLLELEDDELRAHRDEILHAALLSYPEVFR